ncbi:hypothetical protein D3C72_1895580 [compost metagenome]
MAGMQLQRLPVTTNLHANDPAVVGDQVLEVGVQPQWNVTVHQRTAQRGDQRTAQGGAAVAPALAAPFEVELVAQHQAENQQAPAKGARHGLVRMPCGPGDAPHQQCRG